MNIPSTQHRDFPEIITLCGSTKFKAEYTEIMKKLTLQGKIVISVGLFGHADNEPITNDQKEMLDTLHFRKIDLSHGIFVIDVNGYIGQSTSREIEYARETGKFIQYYSQQHRST